MDWDEYKIESYQSRIKLTGEVLSSISSHLSSRRECRGKVYRVAIGVKDNKQRVSRDWPFDHEESIFFDTAVRIKPSRRKGEHKIPPIQHIMLDHFPEICAGVANGNQVQIHFNKLIPGIYEYRKTANSKYRRWCKLSEEESR